MISRNHARLELREDGLFVVDLSTNGTVVRKAAGAYGVGEQVQLAGGAPYPLEPNDTVELHAGVVLARADRMPSLAHGHRGSVMDDAPTMTMRPQL
jgi:pSer/pThr/pTyr-binding forkhead associated (FHA) protein